jgi:hypothetical protein
MIGTIVVKCVQGFHTCWRRHPQVAIGFRSFSLQEKNGLFKQCQNRGSENLARVASSTYPTDMGD